MITFTTEQNERTTIMTSIQPGEYRVNPSIKTDGYPSADGVYVDLDGNAFIGKVIEIENREGDHINNTSGYGVRPFTENGDYIPVVFENWQTRVNQVLVTY